MAPFSRFEDIYKHAPIGLAVLDRDLRFLNINYAMAEMNGISIDRHVGRSIGEILPHLTSTIGEMLQQIFKSGQPMREVEISGMTPKNLGTRRVWIVSATPMMDGGNTAQSILLSMVDITEHKGREERLLETLSHREVMFIELSQRTSLNLKVIRNVLVKQAKLSMEPSARSAYTSASLRLHAASMVHGRLYQPSPKLEHPDAACFIMDLFHDLTTAFTPDNRMHDMLIDCDPGIFLSPDKLVALGMILSELVTDIWRNATARGIADIGIYVGLHKGTGNLAQLMLRDDGKGLSPEFDSATSQGLGMKIVLFQVKHLQGTIEIKQTPRGAEIDVTFPLSTWTPSNDILFRFGQEDAIATSRSERPYERRQMLPGRLYDQPMLPLLDERRPN